jgi:hypothetical protein
LPFNIFDFEGAKNLHHGSKNKHKAFLAFLICQGMQDFDGGGCQFFLFSFKLIGVS